jgi:phage host-nuclease inhibitor protein Gam
MEVRECPVCRTAVTCNRVEEEEKRMKDLMDDLKSSYEAKEYSKAKKLIKEISMLNRQMELPGVDEYVKSIRKEIFRLSDS